MSDATRAIVLECNRLNSVEVPNGLANVARDQHPNGDWTNVFAPIKLEPGDTITLQNAIINEVGANQDSIELSGDRVKGKRYTDNSVVFEFSYYLNHNGINSVGLPTCLERHYATPTLNTPLLRNQVELPPSYTPHSGARWLPTALPSPNGQAPMESVGGILDPTTEEYYMGNWISHAHPGCFKNYHQSRLDWNLNLTGGFPTLSTFGLDNVRTSNRLLQTDSGRYTKMHPKFYPFKGRTGAHWIQVLGYYLNTAPINTHTILCHAREDGTPPAVIGDWIKFRVGAPPGIGSYVSVTNVVVSQIDLTTNPRTPNGIRPHNANPSTPYDPSQERTIYEITCNRQIIPLITDPGATPASVLTNLQAGDELMVVEQAYYNDPTLGGTTPANEDYFKIFTNKSQHVFPETFQTPTNIASKITLGFHKTESELAYTPADQSTSTTLTAPSTQSGWYDVQAQTISTSNPNIFQNHLKHLNKISMVSMAANGVDMKRVPSTPHQAFGIHPASAAQDYKMCSPPNPFDTEFELYPQIFVREPERVIGGSYLNNCDVYEMMGSLTNNPPSNARAGSGGTLSPYECNVPIVINHYIAPTSLNGLLPGGAAINHFNCGLSAFDGVNHGLVGSCQSYFDSDVVNTSTLGNDPNTDRLAGGQPIFTNILFTPANLERVRQYCRRTESYIGSKVDREEAEKDVLSRPEGEVIDNMVFSPGGAPCGSLYPLGGSHNWEGRFQFGRSAIEKPFTWTPNIPPAVPVAQTDYNDIGNPMIPPWTQGVVAGTPMVPNSTFCPTMDGVHNGTGLQDDKQLGAGTFNVRTRWDRNWRKKTFNSLEMNDGRPCTSPGFAANDVLPIDRRWGIDTNFIAIWPDLELKRWEETPIAHGGGGGASIKDLNISFYPYTYFPNGGGASVDCGYFIYNSMGSKLGDGRIDITAVNPNKSLVQGTRVYWGNFAGVSPSFYDQPTIMPINRNKVPNPEVLKSDWDKLNAIDAVNYLNIGASDMSLNFENELSRFSFTDMHTGRQVGFLDPLGHDPVTGDPTSQIGSPYMTFRELVGNIIYYFRPGTAASAGVNDAINAQGWGFLSQAACGRFQGALNIMNCVAQQQLQITNTLGAANQLYNTNSNQNFDINVGVSDSLTGLFLEKVYFGKPQYDDDTIDLNNEDNVRYYLIDGDVNNFKGSILHRMGFEYRDLFPSFSFYNNRSYALNDLTYNNKINKRVGVRPLTTNSNATMSAVTSMDIVDTNRVILIDALTQLAGDAAFPAVPGGTTETLTTSAPNYQLGYGVADQASSQSQINILGDPTDSAPAIASNLIRRAANSFFKIYCSLPGPQYIAGGENSGLPCIGIALKSYASNDFFYSYNPGYTIRIDQPLILSSIRTQIVDANGRVARVSSASCVMYLINKQYKAPQPSAAGVSLTNKLLISMLEVMAKGNTKNLSPGIQKLINGALGIMPAPPPAPRGNGGGGGGALGLTNRNRSNPNQTFQPPRGHPNPFVLGSNSIAGGQGVGDNPLLMRMLLDQFHQGLPPDPQLVSALNVDGVVSIQSVVRRYLVQRGELDPNVAQEQAADAAISAPQNVVEVAPISLGSIKFDAEGMDDLRRQGELERRINEINGELNMLRIAEMRTNAGTAEFDRVQTRMRNIMDERSQVESDLAAHRAEGSHAFEDPTSLDDLQSFAQAYHPDLDGPNAEGSVGRYAGSLERYQDEIEAFQAEHPSRYAREMRAQNLSASRRQFLSDYGLGAAENPQAFRRAAARGAAATKEMEEEEEEDEKVAEERDEKLPESGEQYGDVPEYEDMEERGARGSMIDRYGDPRADADADFWAQLGALLPGHQDQRPPSPDPAGVANDLQLAAAMARADVPLAAPDAPDQPANLYREHKGRPAPAA